MIDPPQYTGLVCSNVEAELWRFPDRFTAIGRMIDSYLTGKTDTDDAAVHLLFSANRWEKRCGLQHFHTNTYVRHIPHPKGKLFARGFRCQPAVMQGGHARSTPRWPHIGR